MSDSSAPPSAPSPEAVLFEKMRAMVESEFGVEDAFVEFGIPTFYVGLRKDLKEAFLRLYRCLDPMGFVPTLRRRSDRVVLQVLSKPQLGRGRGIVNVFLLLATIGTLLISGYLQSVTALDAVLFAVAVMAILGSHEMGHKLTANKYGVEATYPYFIPGLPPPLGLGTFGAVIQQKSLAPNRDALFDIGATGPIVGFLFTVVVALVGVSMSKVYVVSEIPSGSAPMPLLLELFVLLLHNPLASGYAVLEVHPVALAGWAGMLVTMWNLLPIGTLDGGHVIHSLWGSSKARSVLSFLSIFLLLIFGFYVMAFLVLFLSRYQHPAPLDGVSEISTSRKIVAVGLVVIFVLCLAPSL